MSILNIKGVRFEKGAGARIISEDQLRERSKLTSSSKWLEMIRKYGGKKLKVYGYDADTDRVWMSADHSDTYKWKAFMLDDVFKVTSDEEDAPHTQVRTDLTAAAVNHPGINKVPKKNSRNKIVKLMFLMSLMDKK